MITVKYRHSAPTWNSSNSLCNESTIWYTLSPLRIERGSHILVHFNCNSSPGGSISNDWSNQNYNCDTFKNGHNSSVMLISGARVVCSPRQGIHTCLYMWQQLITFSTWSWRLTSEATILLQFTAKGREGTLLENLNSGIDCMRVGGVLWWYIMVLHSACIFPCTVSIWNY